MLMFIHVVPKNINWCIYCIEHVFILFIQTSNRCPLKYLQSRQQCGMRVGRAFVWVALVLGLSHAFWSFYWAFGGTWMLDTVGHWAVVSQLHTPGQTFIVLIVIGLVKTAAAVIPVAVEYGKLGGRRFWRLISWVG